MPNSPDRSLLVALLDGWERNNTITINLLRAVPDDAMDLKPINTTPSIAQLFAHLDYCRLIFVLEDAPEFARVIRNNQGQIKLTLKLAGRPLLDHDIGRGTWDIWMDKTT